METRMKRFWFAALAALSLVACATEEGRPSGVGQLDLPLVSTGSGGALFALGGTFDLVGPESISTVVNPSDPNWQDDALVLNPRVGSYTLTLSNWTLYEMVDDGNGNVGATPVTGAILLSSAMQAVEILNGQATYVVFQFAVPGSGTIVFARGALNVDFTVEQGFPVGAACTSDLECASRVCAAGTCAEPTCFDGVQNGTETSPDCGPECACSGGTTPCTPAQSASCPAGWTCYVDASNTVVCDGGFPPAGAACSAEDALLCPDPNGSCTYDGMGGIVCEAVSDPLACVKINEVSTFGPGGQLDEFVELYNACGAGVSLAGSQVLYRSATSFVNLTLYNFPTVTMIPPGGHLVLAGPGYSNGPVEHMFNGVDMAQGGGGLAFAVNGLIADSVAWGNAANGFGEGANALAVLGVGMSLSRIPDGSDTQDNRVDFLETLRTPGFPN